MYPVIVRQPDRSYVRTHFTSSAAEELQLLTSGAILIMIRASSHDADSKHFVKSLVEQALTPVLSLIKTFLGHDRDISGGTIGEPIVQEPYVHTLRCRLTRTLYWLGEELFAPPFTTEEKCKRCFAEYLYEFTWR
jgi:hypothetical protein